MKKNDIIKIVVVLSAVLIGITGLVVMFIVVDMLDMLKSPALSSNITIEKLTINSQGTATCIEVELHNLSIQANSKTIDLLLLAISQEK